MTVLRWPDALPRPTRQGYQSTRLDNRTRRKTASVGGYRGRYSQTASSLNLVINVTRSQKAAFDQFYDHTTNNAVLPFMMSDPTTDGWSLLDDLGQPILGTTGAPLLLACDLLCMFGQEPPVESIAGVRFDISFSVLVLP